FISRKTGRLYVRQGFEPIFDVPVTIRDADKPLGTYLYTAVAFKEDKTTMRWVAVPLEANASEPVRAIMHEAPPRKGRKADHAKDNEPRTTSGSVRLAAAAALDRIELPKEAVDRISETLSPGATLIISDYPISPETG